MNFKKLTPALFAFVISIAPALAQLPRLEEPVKITSGLAITEVKSEKPTYRQWQSVNFIDKIEYRQNEIVVFYRYQNGGSATIHAPNTELAWVLKDTKGNIYKVKSITNLKDGDKLISANVTQQEHISSYSETNGEYTYRDLNLTCELHFDRLPADVNQVDLVEGVGRETWSNHFNAFEIQIQQPKELKADEVIVQNLEAIPHVEEPINWDEWLPAYPDAEETALNAEEENVGEYEIIYQYDENGELVLDENGEPLILDIIFPEYPEYSDNVAFEEEYQEPLEITVPAFELSEKIKTDKNPKVRQWQKDYDVTRIEYHEKEMVITFQNTSKNYISSTFYGPEGEHPWFLRDKDGNVYPMKALNTLKYNGEVKAEGISTQVHISSDWDDTRKKHVATCQIVFDRLPAGVKVVDLIEGEGRETYSNHFNVFDIKIKQFETKVEPAVEPAIEPVVEPVIVENNERPNGIEQVAVSSSYTLFPNPNRGTFFLTNNGKTQNDATVQVLDLAGKLIYTQNAVALQEKNSQSFQVANLPAGQYTIRIQHSDKTVESLKMIVVE